MGCAASTDAVAQLAIDQKIHVEMRIAERNEGLKMKVLLIGAEESGKSTILKQMRIIYGRPRTDDNLRMFGVVIRSNCITVMRKLCRVIRMLEMEDDLEEEEAESMTPFEAFELLTSHLLDNSAPPIETVGLSDDWVGHCATAGLESNNDAQMFLQLWKPMKILWQSQTMQKKVWLKRSIVNMIDGHTYFLASKSFKPNEQDVLLARVQTNMQVVVME